MEITHLLAIAVALAMDALAVAVATGLRLHCVTLNQTFRMAGTFGFFQGAMPVIGWLLGSRMQKYVTGYDHWLAFALLAFIGLRMVWEAWKMYKEGENFECPDPTRGGTLLLMALATSIDALAVGFSLAMLKMEIWHPALVIGLVCAALTALGMHAGRLVRNSCSLGSISNAIGGVVLLLIGLNILRGHGVF